MRRPLTKKRGFGVALTYPPARPNANGKWEDWNDLLRTMASTSFANPSLKASLGKICRLAFAGGRAAAASNSWRERRRSGTTARWRKKSGTGSARPSSSWPQRSTRTAKTGVSGSNQNPERPLEEGRDPKNRTRHLIRRYFQTPRLSRPSTSTSLPEARPSSSNY